MQSKNHKPVLFRLRMPLLIFIQQHLFLLSLPCLKRPWPSIVYYQLVSHNTQTTKFPTQPLTNGNDINFVAYTKKVDNGSKQKPKP